MPRSKRWNNLKREITTLRKQFLPDKFDTLGRYPDGVRVRAYTRAFLVLCHAEIETYLEEWAKDIARTSETVWQSSGKMTTPLTYLVATLAERITPPNTLRGPNPKDSPQRFVEVTAKLFQRFYKRIKDNHGIKEANVLTLFDPLGIPATALGTTLLPNLDSLGATRGTHAHQSSKAVPSVLDPETEYKKIDAILTDLIAFDEWLVTYRRRIR
jgi:hypothetical protein